MAEDRAKYDEKLDLILRKAAAIFADKGYHQASIRDISRATGISLSGLYYYVRSKEELLFRIQDHAFATVLENLERLIDGVAEPERRLRLLVENHLRFFVSNMKEMKVLSHEADVLTGEARQRVDARKRQYVGVCAGIMAELQPQGSAADPRVATFSLFGMMNWIYTWYHPDRDVPVEQLAADMTQIFLNGYLSCTPAAAGEVRGMGDSRPSIWRR